MTFYAAFPYTCQKRKLKHPAGHWPNKIPRDTTYPPARGICMYCRNHIFLRQFKNNARRYAATILIREWP